MKTNMDFIKIVKLNYFIVLKLRKTVKNIPYILYDKN